MPGTLQVKDSAKQAEEDAAELDKSMSIIKYFLLGFGAVALLVGAFVIFNTLSITVAQRTREFATLRTLGASRKQVMRSVVAEGLVIGVVASVIGLFAGIGLAKGMVALFAALDVELPDAATVIAPRTIVLSILVGTITTLVASILPAKRATRVPPIAAVREGSTLPRVALSPTTRPRPASSSRRCRSPRCSPGCSPAGSAPSGSWCCSAAACSGCSSAWRCWRRAWSAPLARLVGWPARRRGIAGELAGANAVRNPGRTASTAAALMIGLTLVTLVAVLASSLNAAGTKALKEEVHAGYIIDGKDGLPFRAAEGDALAQVPGVKSASHVRSDTVLIDGDERTITGIDPATIAHFYTFKWAKGSEQALGSLGTDGALVKKGYAESHDLAIGSTFTITTPTGAKPKLVVRGIHKNKTEMLADVSMTQQAFDKVARQPRNSVTFLDGGATADIEAKVKGFGDATFHTGAGYAADQSAKVAKMLSMLYVLLGFSVIVSLFGMVNTLVLSVFERTREIGMLRTIGMTRRQARQMIRHESIITALIGAALGLGVGIALATLVMVKWHLPIAIPAGTLLVFTLVAVLAGVGAAVMPARRASRLNVLQALQYE